MLLATAAAGLAVGGYLFYILVEFPIASRPVGGHVEYVSPHFFAALTMTLYLLSTTVSLVLSSRRVLNLFGGLALLSFGGAYYFYTTWLISVWCFFAALLSIVVYLHFLPRAPSLIEAKS